MAVTRHTISIDPKVSEAGVKRAEALKYDTFSEYVEYLIRKDTAERPAHVTVREEGEDYRPGKPAGDPSRAGGSDAQPGRKRDRA